MGYNFFHFKAIIKLIVYVKICFPGGDSGKELACQCRRHKRLRFDPWVRKILWRRAWQVLAWRIPWTEEPGRLQSIGSHRVRHD